MLELKASEITTNHLVQDQSGNFSQVVKTENDGGYPALYFIDLLNGNKIAVSENTYLNTKRFDEVVNLYNLPEYIQDESNCSVSTKKGEQIRFTREEAQELCNRHNLTLVGAMWYEEGTYTKYLAIENDSIYILTLAHSYSYTETGEYISKPILQAQLDNCDCGSIFSTDEEIEEWNNKIGQFVNIVL